MRDPLLDVLLGPFPPVPAVLRLLRRMGEAPDAIRLARTLLLPMSQLGEELFKGRDGRLLLAGNAMHADIPAVAAGSGGFGWLLCMLGQDVGFPVPVGGAGALAGAIAARARAAGADLLTGARVERIVVGGGRALGVVTADGRRIRARRAVLADVSVPSLYRELLPPDQVPARVLRRPRPVHLGPADGQDQLGGRRARPVARRGRAAGGHRPPRRGRPADLAMVGRSSPRARRAT